MGKYKKEKSHLEKVAKNPRKVNTEKNATTLCLVEALDHAGIIFQENFTCCNTCGASQIEDFKMAHHIGYCFFHAQDCDHAAEHGHVNLSFGSFKDTPDDCLVVGRKIVEVATSKKLVVDWNQDIDQRILVKNLDKKYYQSLMAEDDENSDTA